MTDVDAFVARHVPPDLQDLAAAVRAVLRACAPHATEQIAYGLPMWKQYRYVAWISPSRRGLSVGFTHGVHFRDPHGHLRGNAKHARHLRLQRAGDLDESVLRDFVQQALADDAARYG